MMVKLHSDIPILYYRDIAVSGIEQGIALLSEFQKQIQHLEKNNYKIINLDEIKKYLEQNHELPENCAALVFEARDGFLLVSDFLTEKNIKALVYVAVKDVGQPGFLDWPQIKELSEDFEIGSAGLTSADFLSMDEEQLEKEIFNSKKIIKENIHKNAEHFFFNLSRYDDYNVLQKIKERIKSSNYKTALTGRDLLNNKFIDSLELSIRPVFRNTFLGKFAHLLKTQSISICMIARNEEDFIAKCLESIKDIADEILVVDNGSTDRTKEIVSKYNAKIIDNNWNDDFSEARNIYLKNASSDWILVLDADEIIERKDLAVIKKLVELDFDAYNLVLYNYSNNDSDMGFVKSEKYSAKGYLPAPNIRLFRNNKKYYYTGAVHESLDSSLLKTKAKIGNTDVPIHHLEILKGAEAIKKKQISYLDYSRKKLQENPADIKAICDIGLIYMNFLDNYSEAEHYFSKALSVDNKNIRALMLLGQLFVKQKKYKEALEAYEKAAWLEPDNKYATENISQLRTILNQQAL